ncbi:MAG: hypothetical protein AAF125_02455 [Chloroflexota bacterium]
MFGDITAAFGFTVLLCMAPSLLIALIFPPILMYLTRPTAQPTQPGEQPTRKKRNFLMAGIAYAQFYFISLVIIIGASILFWWGFITFNGETAAVEFAAQQFPVDEAQLEEAVEPAADPTITLTPSS